MIKSLKIISAFILFLITLEACSWIWLRTQEDESYKNWKIEWKDIRPADNSKRPELADLFPGTLAIQSITQPDGKKTVIEYSLNEFGLRGPSPVKEKKKSHLLISGDSYVFGQAVPENKTISSLLQSLHPEMRVMNLGWSGGGMHTALRIFYLLNPREYAPEDKGTLVYVFLNFHVYRWLSRPRFIRWIYPDVPVYKVINGGVVFQGKVRELWQWKLFRMLRRSSFGNIVLNSLMDVGVSYRKEDVQLYFDAIEEFRRRYQKIYPQGRFVVLTHPLQEDYTFIPGVAAEAKRRGIEFYDSIPAWKKDHKKDDRAYLVPGDGHPKGEVNEFLSEFISQKILSSEGPVKR